MDENNRQRFWVDDFTQALFEEFLDEGQLIYFQFQDKDYLIERYSDGFMIADPFPYYENGGFPDNPEFQYPYSFSAKTVQDFLKLPFLDGRSVFEQWDSIKFWDY